MDRMLDSTMYEMDEVSCSDGLRLFPLPSDRDFLLMCRRLPLSLTLNALNTFLVRQYVI